MIPLVAVVLVVVLLILAFVVPYNGLVRKRGAVDNAWAQIEVQLERRDDLVPNLVETVRGYAVHERQTLDAVVAARARALGAQNPKDRADAENGLTSALKSLFAVAEAYPDLQAGRNFSELQEELSATENRIALGVGVGVAVVPLVRAITDLVRKEDIQRQVVQLRRFQTGSGGDGGAQYAYWEPRLDARRE
ncbi:LemA family protein [Streptomyces sp. NPDC052043]|uniref:LemA family protein n=1 Tax=Streptomyces sp. NPDC052043 TaxID=3365684 RepID=UPI0037D8F5F2